MLLLIPVENGRRFHNNGSVTVFLYGLLLDIANPTKFCLKQVAVCNCWLSSPLNKYVRPYGLRTYSEYYHSY
jgi:hypothetical protein